MLKFIFQRLSRSITLLAASCVTFVMVHCIFTTLISLFGDQSWSTIFQSGTVVLSLITTAGMLAHCYQEYNKRYRKFTR